MSEELERIEPQQPIGFLDILRAVIKNPDVPVEKVKMLAQMQFEAEDRRAKKEFDIALSEAQREIETLKWDKVNPSNRSHYVGYPKIDKMLKPVREKYGFSQSFDTEPHDAPNMMYMVIIVSHRDGHTERRRLPMPIDGSGPKGGGVMTGPQAVGNGTSYGMRYLVKMFWNIPLLVDKDDNDGNDPCPLVDDKDIAELRALADEVDADLPKFCEYMSKVCHRDITKLDDIPKADYDRAVKALQKKRQ